MPALQGPAHAVLEDRGDQRDEEDDEENEEQNPRHAGGGRGHAAKTEHTRHQAR